MKRINYIKFIFALLMAFYAVLCLKAMPESGALDRVNLVAHEAGHLFFSWFGEFIQVIGGTLGQLSVPAAVAVYFYSRREFFSSSVALFWAGQNFLGISVYISDARAMELPLLSVGGGDDVIHDWNYILSKIGLLRWSHSIGTVVLSAGVIAMLLAILWAMYSSIQVDEGAVE